MYRTYLNADSVSNQTDEMDSQIIMRETLLMIVAGGVFASLMTVVILCLALCTFVNLKRKRDNANSKKDNE
nr:MAG TPA: Cell-membrane associated Mucin15 [Caudoviricetes sp.]